VFSNSVLDRFVEARQTGSKLFVLLLDPGSGTAALDRFEEQVEQAEQLGVDLLFLGGSLVNPLAIHEATARIKRITRLPVVLFPGSALQVCPEADAILFLSLVSGRNPEYLIGQHVVAAPLLEQYPRLEIIPTAYLLIDSGRPTSASYMSGTQPLPHDKPELARYTALASQYLGLRLVYLDAGSGAQIPVSGAMIQAVRSGSALPMIVGGGLRSAEAITQVLQAGADAVVVGNYLEADDFVQRLEPLVAAVQAFQPTTLPSRLR
jgi:putative glycerol-1-phosphate prenyltransferase